MKALILEAPGKIVLTDQPLKRLDDEELLIEVKSATTCGTDLKAWKRGHPQIPMPGPFGHEYSGVVADAGRHARFAVGDSVMGVHTAPCLACRWCMAGQQNLCETIMSAKVLGAYAQFLVIPARIARLNMYEKPDGLSFDIAALLEPLACVVQGLSHLGLMEGPTKRFKSCLVIGPGAIGLMFVAVAKAVGFETVVLAGRNHDRLQIGRELGAQAMPFSDLAKAGAGDIDLVIECTGRPEVWELAPSLCRRGGTAMLFGGLPSGQKVTFEAARLHYDQVDLVSPFHFGADAVRMARDLIVESKVSLAPLISGVRKLEEADQVFHDLDAGKGVKYVFHP